MIIRRDDNQPFTQSQDTDGDLRQDMLDELAGLRQDVRAEIMHSRQDSTEAVEQQRKAMIQQVAEPLNALLELTMEQQAAWHAKLRDDARQETVREDAERREQRQQEQQEQERHKSLLDSITDLHPQLGEVVDGLRNVGDNLKSNLVDLAATIGSMAAIQKSIAASFEYTQAGMHQGYNSLNGESLYSRMWDEFSRSGGMQRTVSTSADGSLQVEYNEQEFSSMFQRVFARSMNSRMEGLALQYGKSADEMHEASMSMVRDSRVEIDKLESSMEDVALFSSVFGRSVGDISEMYKQGWDYFEDSSDSTYRNMVELAAFQKKVMDEANVGQQEYIDGISRISEELKGQVSTLRDQRQLYSGLVLQMMDQGNTSQDATDKAAELTADLLGVEGKDEGLVRHMVVDTMQELGETFRSLGLTSANAIEEHLLARLAEDSRSIDPATGEVRTQYTYEAEELARYMARYMNDQTLAQEATFVEGISTMLNSNQVMQRASGMNEGIIFLERIDEMTASLSDAARAQALRNFGFGEELIKQVTIQGESLAGLARTAVDQAGEVDFEEASQDLEEQRDVVHQEAVVNSLTDISGTLGKIYGVLSGIPALVLTVGGIAMLLKGRFLRNLLQNSTMLRGVMQSIPGLGRLVPAATTATTATTAASGARAASSTAAAASSSSRALQAASPAATPAAATPGMGSRALSVGSKALGAAGAGFTGYLTYQERMAELEQDDSFTQGQRRVQAAGSGIGAGGGALAGAAAGAAIGSVVPVVGTAIGAIAGGLLGSWLGGKAGDELGKQVSDVMGGEDDSEVIDGEYEVRDTRPSTNSSFLGADVGQFARDSRVTRDTAPVTESTVGSSRSARELPELSDVVGDATVSPISGDLVIKGAGPALIQYIERQKRNENVLLQSNRGA